MRDRQFVWTWWAGTVPDYFGTRSVFHVARFGVLRIRRACGASSAGKPVGGDDDARAPSLLVSLLNCVPTQGFLVSKGLTDLGGD